MTIEKYHLNFRGLHLKQDDSFGLSRNFQLGIKKFGYEHDSYLTNVI